MTFFEIQFKFNLHLAMFDLLSYAGVLVKCVQKLYTKHILQMIVLSPQADSISFCDPKNVQKIF